MHFEKINSVYFLHVSLRCRLFMFHRVVCFPYLNLFKICSVFFFTKIEKGVFSFKRKKIRTQCFFILFNAARRKEITFCSFEKGLMRNFFCAYVLIKIECGGYCKTK